MSSPAGAAAPDADRGAPACSPVTPLNAGAARPPSRPQLAPKKPRQALKPAPKAARAPRAVPRGFAVVWVPTGAEYKHKEWRDLFVKGVFISREAARAWREEVMGGYDRCGGDADLWVAGGGGEDVVEVTVKPAEFFAPVVNRQARRDVWVLLWVPTNGKGRRKKFTNLTVHGVFDSQYAANIEKEALCSKYENCGHGDISVGGTCRDEVHLEIRKTELHAR